MYGATSQGDVVRSTSGKEKGRLFFVVMERDGYLYLADGKRRKIEQPKKKKSKHTVIVNTGVKTSEAIRSGCAVSNKQLRKELAVLRAGASGSESEEVTRLWQKTT
jgi:ribosomal protein L14E/L6E/L27E